MHVKMIVTFRSQSTIVPNIVIGIIWRVIVDELFLIVLLSENIVKINKKYIF